MVKRAIYFILVLIIAFFYAGCDSGNNQQAEAAQWKVLRLSITQDVPTANFQSATGINDITRHITASLYQRIPGEDRESVVIIPLMAASYPTNPSGDGMTWRVPLNRDAKWQNGELINADTFIYSYQNILPIIIRSGKC